MKHKIFVITLAVIFLISQVSPAFAKGSSGGGRSGGGSFSRSSGYSGSSSSKSSAGSYSGSSSSKSFGGSSGSSGYTGSSSSNSGSSSSGSSRSVPGSYSSSGSSSGSGSSYSGSSSSKAGSSSASSVVNSKTDTARNSYMQDYYKKQTSTSNYNTYKQNLNDEQKRVYDSSMNKNYTVNNRINMEDALRTRPERISGYSTRPVIVNINNNYWGGFGSGPFSYGSAFVGPWDLWFLMRASDLFWYHHWLDIYPYRSYFDAVQFAQMEERVRRLEQQNNGVRDPNYLEKGVDYDLQFSNDYQQNHMNNLYYTNKYSNPVSNPFVTFVIIILIVILLIFLIRKVSRPKPKRAFDSRIY